jgi:O-antigen ligase
VVALAIYVVGWTGPQRLRLLGLTAAGLLAMSVITPNFLNSVIGLFAGAGEDPSVVSRADSFSLAFEFIASDPLFGRGLGTFLPKYRIFDNQYLLLLVTIGVVGTTAFLALGATAFFTVLRVRGRVRDGATRDIALALAASIAAGFTCLFMFDAFAFPMTMGTLFLIMGIGGALRRIESTRSGLTALLQ